MNARSGNLRDGSSGTGYSLEVEGGLNRKRGGAAKARKNRGLSLRGCSGRDGARTELVEGVAFEKNEKKNERGTPRPRKGDHGRKCGNGREIAKKVEMGM